MESQRSQQAIAACCDFIAVSSGSTGQPRFWPRFLSDELSIATRFEQIFHDSFQADSRRTLAVVCFTLGTWVGGMFTASLGQDLCHWRRNCTYKLPLHRRRGLAHR